MQYKKRYNFMLSDKVVKALDFWSNYMGLSKSAVISLAISNYLMNKDEFRNSPKMRELLSEEIEIYEGGKK